MLPQILINFINKRVDSNANGGPALSKATPHQIDKTASHRSRIANLCARFVHRLERVKQCHPAAFVVLDVAGNNDQAIHARGRGKAYILDMLIALC